jgi:hypothetical protein
MISFLDNLAPEQLSFRTIWPWNMTAVIWFRVSSSFSEIPNFKIRTSDIPGRGGFYFIFRVFFLPKVDGFSVFKDVFHNLKQSIQPTPVQGFVNR